MRPLFAYRILFERFMYQRCGRTSRRLRAHIGDVSATARDDGFIEITGRVKNGGTQTWDIREESSHPT